MAPAWFAAGFSVLILDFAVYLQHYLLHHISFLWRVHRVHHSDPNLDFTTGLRFHPIEALVTVAANMVLIIALGAPPIAVVIFQALATFISFFQHGNLSLPNGMNSILSLFLITPDTHRIHHSQELSDSMSNLGNVFPWWDWILGTYADEPEAGHGKIAFGFAQFCDEKHLTLFWILAQPFL